MTKPIELYFWPTPNGWKISIALEEMGLPYELKPVNIGTGDQFAPAFLKISPNNRMPAIVDPDGPGGAPISIFESGAILQYLGRKSGQFYPSDVRARSEVEQWLYWQVGGLGPMAGQASHFVNYAPKLVDDQALIEYGRARYVNELNRLCGVMERRLGEAPYLAGDYSIADMASWPWARIADKLGQDFEDFPKLKDWVDRIHERPAVQRALKAGEELRQKQALSKEEVRDAAKHLFGQTANSVNGAKSKQG
ncbi:MAG: thiol:disulfide oxidoreductase [Alphaproteobacteria bacterium]|nr:MAG: thiol:disulfide oxidoreductase [Alphaproteobacteria bacterium]